VLCLAPGAADLVLATDGALALWVPTALEWRGTLCEVPQGSVQQGSASAAALSKTCALSSSTHTMSAARRAALAGASSPAPLLPSSEAMRAHSSCRRCT
jgi:hypothetical protein